MNRGRERAKNTAPYLHIPRHNKLRSRACITSRRLAFTEMRLFRKCIPIRFDGVHAPITRTHERRNDFFFMFRFVLTPRWAIPNANLQDAKRFCEKIIPTRRINWIIFRFSFFAVHFIWSQNDERWMIKCHWNWTQWCDCKRIANSQIKLNSNCSCPLFVFNG